MIVSLKGQLESVGETTVVVGVQGIGYEVSVTGAVLRQLPALGEELELTTYLQVREDAMVLYGFASREERDLFLQIIGVAGIGPKTGLAILSSIAPEDFIRAVQGQKLKTLTSLPGIGRKTGERILLELKDKFKGATWAAAAGEGTPLPVGGVPDDAVEALQALGYSSGEAERMVSWALAELKGDCDLQGLLKVALASNSQQRGEGVWNRKE